MFFNDGKEVCQRLTGYISYAEFREAVENSVPELALAERSTIHCDVLIIGAGPAGLTAAIYAARSRLFTVVLIPESREDRWPPHIRVANYPDKRGNPRP